MFVASADENWMRNCSSTSSSKANNCTTLSRRRSTRIWIVVWWSFALITSSCARFSYDLLSFHFPSRLIFVVVTLTFFVLLKIRKKSCQCVNLKGVKEREWTLDSPVRPIEFEIFTIQFQLNLKDYEINNSSAVNFKRFTNSNTVKLFIYLPASRCLIVFSVVN